MAFEEQLPQWENEGTQPPQSKRVEGWLPNEKPPASWFNWLFGRIYKVLQEIHEKAETKVGAQAKVDAHANATTGVHGATSAATPNTIVQRDASGRAKFAAPAASDDAARKAEVDAVQTNLNTHMADKVTDPGGVHGLVLESGFWTPVLKFGGSNEGMVIDVQSGRYSKVGAIVTVFCDMRLSAKGTSTGNAIIEGLPFSNAGGLVTCALGEWTKIDLPTNYTVPSVRLDPNSSSIALRRNGDDLLAENIDDTHLFDNTAIRFSFSYSI